MPPDRKGRKNQHVVMPAPQPPTTEPKRKQRLRKEHDWARVPLGRDTNGEATGPAQAGRLPRGAHVPHVHRTGDAPDTPDEPKLADPPPGTSPDEAPLPGPADVGAPQRSPGGPPPPLSPVPTGPQAHVVRPAEPPPTDEPKLGDALPAEPPAPRAKAK